MAATGSLNNLEQIVPEELKELGSPVSTVQWALINSFFSVGGILGSYGVVAPLAFYVATRKDARVEHTCGSIDGQRR